MRLTTVHGEHKANVIITMFNLSKSGQLNMTKKSILTLASIDSAKDILKLSVDENADTIFISGCSQELLDKLNKTLPAGTIVIAAMCG